MAPESLGRAGMALSGLAAAGGGAGGVVAALRRHGPAPGGARMLEAEWEGAVAAADRREAGAPAPYEVWRRPGGGEDCARVGPSARCFCGHSRREHGPALGACGARSGKAGGPCACPRFRYVPDRPEAVGEWWLPRRRGFQVRRWRAKCRCGHGHDRHDAGGGGAARCLEPGCACRGFAGAFTCLVCDGPWEAHATLAESEGERAQAGLPTGAAFFPLQAHPEALAELRRAAGGGAAFRDPRACLRAEGCRCVLCAPAPGASGAPGAPAGAPGPGAPPLALRGRSVAKPVARGTLHGLPRRAPPGRRPGDGGADLPPPDPL